MVIDAQVNEGIEGGDVGVRMCRVLAVGFVVECNSWYVRPSFFCYTELNWTELSLICYLCCLACVIQVLMFEMRYSYSRL